MTTKKPTEYEIALRAVAYLEKYINNSELPGNFIAKSEQYYPPSKMQYLRMMPPADIAELAQRFGVDESYVKSRAEAVIDYCEAKGKKYKNYKAALRNFIRGDLKNAPVPISTSPKSKTFTPSKDAHYAITETDKKKVAEWKEKIKETLSMRK